MISEQLGKWDIILLCMAFAMLAYAWTKLRGDKLRMEGV